MTPEEPDLGIDCLCV